MFLVRLRSSIIIVILTVASLYFGGIYTLLVVGVVSLFGIYELLKIYKLEKTLLGILVYVTTIIFFAFTYLGWEEHIWPLVIGFLILLLAVYVFCYPKYKIDSIIVPFFSFFYVAVTLSYIYKIRSMKHGILLVIFIFVCSWGNDTCAYLVGICIGKHKMSPNLSPKKSVEGAVGGVLGTTLLGFVFGIVFQYYLAPNTSYCALIFSIIGFIGAFPAIIGDLAASAIKRNHNIKDYSNLIPGHGGILDRFDSIIFTAPMVYYLLVYMIEKAF